MNSKESDITLFDWYAHFAEQASRLLKGVATVALGAVLALLVTSIYVSAYLMPLAGAGILLYGVLAFLTGDAATAAACAFGGGIFVTFGSISYHEWFVGRWGDMVPITRVPQYLAGVAAEYRNA